MAFKIVLKGVVQGVGFRPFVYNLALKKGITGNVKNSSEGVEITLFEDFETSSSFLNEIINKAPRASFISSWDIYEVDLINKTQGFEIIHSEKKTGVTMVSPDLAICEDCKKEFYDPTNRRYLYPFINCTNCGPRYTIIETIPYDRPNTSMKSFDMCDKCLEEYENPLNRRFHAQPNACPVCGPEVFYKDLRGIDVIKKGGGVLNQGGIIGVKGLGGYHIMCDASSPKAIEKLRKFKNRNYKPFAVMVKNEEILNKNGIFLTSGERDIFNSCVGPIVIVEAEEFKWNFFVNPVGTKIGFMKAYTPLHLLIFEYFKGDFLVATSGNLRDEPIAIDEYDAEERLTVCDMFIHHNREIVNRVDDSLVTLVAEKPYILRRGRGYAPLPVIIKNPLNKQFFGSGAHLKSSLTILKSDYAFVSQYIGDLENYESTVFYDEVYSRMKRLFHISPDLAVCDLHPDYYSSKIVADNFKNIYKVQHHKTHMFACMAENNITDNVIGIIYDGTGLGEDGNIWGGEIFYKLGSEILRKFHLEYVPQVGGDFAVKYPLRMFMNYLVFFQMSENLINKKHLRDFIITKKIVQYGRSFTHTSSMGRFFEALGAFLTDTYENEYEGHTAILLENMCAKGVSDFYDFSISDSEIKLKPILWGVIEDVRKGLDRSVIASKIHNTVAEFSLDSAKRIRDANGINKVCLSGGVFQNIYLLNRMLKMFQKNGFEVFIHKLLPPNDGCISLGQLNYLLLTNQLGNSEQ